MMKFVKVHFNHNTAEKEYTFITEIDLQPDDIVVVDTRHGMTLATVISLTDTLPPFLALEDMKYVIDKVDITAYKARKEKSEKRRALRMQMDEMVSELQNLAVYEALAAKNPEMKKLYEEEGVKFSVSMGKIFFDKNKICIIVLSKFLVFCCRIIYLIIVLPIRLRLYLNFKIFCSTNNGISNPFSWALPTPGLGNKLGFSGNTINAEGIR